MYRQIHTHSHTDKHYRYTENLALMAQELNPFLPLALLHQGKCPHVLCEEKKAGREHTVPGALDPAGLTFMSSSEPAMTFELLPRMQSTPQGPISFPS